MSISDGAVEAECACFMTDPKTWTRYGGAIEPGSVFEPNPDCRVHFTDEERRYAKAVPDFADVTNFQL